MAELPEDLANELLACCSGQEGGATLLEWSVEKRDASTSGEESWRATVSFQCNGVPHHFQGGWCAGGPPAARRNTAERVLWYFGVGDVGFAAEQRPQLEANAAPIAAGGCVAGFGAAAAGGASKGVTDEKTVLMQVQNTLQKALAKDTPP